MVLLHPLRSNCTNRRADCLTPTGPPLNYLLKSNIQYQFDLINLSTLRRSNDF